MSLFHRRNRSAPATRYSNVAASNTAHSAASQAFLASQKSNASLSASAAAQALRTMSPTPTPVGQVQTRRMIQRQNSNGSNGSVSRGRGQTLHRRDSSGSMTERTFRTPSPHGAGHGGPRQPPPVPAIPPTYADVPSLPKTKHRRTVSLEPPPPRVLSPPLIRPAGRGMSTDRQPNQETPAKKAARISSLQNIRETQRLDSPKKTVARVSSFQNGNELQRTDSNNSANFSYPGRARPMSPSNQSAASPPPARSALSPTFNQQATGYAGGASSSGAASATQYDVLREAEQPVKKKKKKVVRSAAEGSHFERGVGGRTLVTPRESGPTSVVQSAATSQPQPAKKKKSAAVSPAMARPMSPSYGSDSDSTPEKKERKLQRASGQLNKQPSIVREDWEGEINGDSTLAPEAQQRQDQGLSPVNSPIAVLQGKKKSTAANVSRKIGEAASSPQVEEQRTYNAVTMAPPLSAKESGYSHLTVNEHGNSVTRNLSLSPSRSMRFSDRLSSDLTAGRKHEPLPRSVSPAKSALKHHSPSPQAASPIDPRFPGRYISSQTASEASDNASNVSADGLSLPARKKKSARVSFEAEPEVVGTAAGVEQTDTSMLAGPQNKEAGKKGWFGFGKSKAPALGTIVAEDEMEEVMKPRPNLPTFGSVRKSGRGTENSDSMLPYPSASTAGPASVTAPHTHPATKISATSSEASSASQIPTIDTSISSDHAIGNLIAQDALIRVQKEVQGKPVGEEIYEQRSSEGVHSLPLPPEVTSVEGTGYASDTDESVHGEDGMQTDTHKQAILVPPTEMPAEIPVTASETAPAELVPTISVQPATPGLEQGPARERDEWLVSVPGGFPVSTEALSSFPTPPLRDEGRQLDLVTPAGLGIAEPRPAELVSAVSSTETPLTSFRRQSADQDDNESSAGDSIYSDAAEEASDHGDGFGSINAIVESPVVASSHNRVTSPPDSPMTRNFNQAQHRPDATNRTASWDQTQAHWSTIAEQYRQGIQQPDEQPTAQQPAELSAAEPTIESSPTTVQSYADKKPSIRKKKKATHAIETATQEPTYLPPDSPPRRLPQSSAYPLVSHATDSAPQQPPPLRHSMRAQPEPDASHFRSTMRPRPQSAGQAIARPTSPQAAPSPKPSGTLQKRNIPPAAVVTAAKAAAANRPQTALSPNSVSRSQQLQRTMSNDSDSSSSFKKRHRRGGSSQDHSMRRTMRAAPVAAQTPIPVGRGGVRSMSPPTNRRPMSPLLGQKTMRSSLRQPVEFQAPNTRAEPQQGVSSSFFGRSKTSKNPPPRATPMPLTKKIQSRFADSDEEDERGSRAFRSRFEDSSEDEAEPYVFRPVRGIPRKADEGDSTDLEDSSEDEGHATKSTVKPATISKNSYNNSTSKATQSLASPTSPSKKGGFFSRFRSKKVKDDSSRPGLGSTPTEGNATLERTKPGVAVAKEDGHISAPEWSATDEKTSSSRLGFATIAERDAVLERTRRRLEENRDQTTSLSNAVPGSQRRPLPERIMSDSWPLPPQLPSAEGARPNTSDGVGLPFTASQSNLRPGGPERQNTADTAHTAGGSPILSVRTGKKKKFPMLRRAFGLTD